MQGLHAMGQQGHFAIPLIAILPPKAGYFNRGCAHLGIIAIGIARRRMGAQRVADAPHPWWTGQRWFAAALGDARVGDDLRGTVALRA